MSTCDRLLLWISVKGIKPRITRGVSIPCNYTLQDLVSVVRISMAWNPLPVSGWLRVKTGGILRKQWRTMETHDPDVSSRTLKNWEWRYPLLIECHLGPNAEWPFTLVQVGEAGFENGGEAFCWTGRNAGPPEDLPGPRAYRQLFGQPMDAEWAGFVSLARPAYDPSAFNRDQINTQLAAYHAQQQK